MKAYKAFSAKIVCKPKISSGYRSPEKNTSVGGAKGSYHLEGKALDIIFPMCLSSLKDLGRIATEFFNGVIVYPGHIHVDIRKTPYFGKGKY